MMVGPQVVGVKAVIGEEEHGRAVIGSGVRFVDQGAEHPILKLIAGLQHGLVMGEVIFRDAGRSRRIELHEGVAKVIDRIEVDGAQIPRFAVHQACGGGVDVGAFGDDARRGVEAAITPLIDFERARHEEFEEVGRKFFGIEAQFRERLAEFRRVDHAGHQFKIRRRALKLI